MDEFANLPGSLFPLPYPSYLPEFKLTALLSEAGTALHTLLWCSPEMQLQESKPGGTGTSIPLAFGTEKVQKKKNQVNWTERYRPYIQTLLFWDGIHLCNRGGFSQTLLRPEICCQTHTQRLLPSAP